MQAEPDVLRRAAIFSFPQQFEGLRACSAASSSRSSKAVASCSSGHSCAVSTSPAALRKARPSTACSAPSGARSVSSSARQSVPSWRGKAFFLTRLLKEVVFAEQGLVGRNLQAEAKRAALADGGAGDDDAGVGRARRRLGPRLRPQPLLSGRRACAHPRGAGCGRCGAAGDRRRALGLPTALDKVAALPTPAAFALREAPLLNKLGLYQAPHIACRH
jgi:type VI secretion system protein ImpL